jgi:hypothetical protein
MKKTTRYAILIVLLVIGCASMAEKSRMKKFGVISESFERALRMSDYTAAAKYIESSDENPRPDFQKLRNFKIVEYNVTHVHVSEDKRKITQDVELQYYQLNSSILHRTVYPQKWQFKPADEVWLLQTGLPDFKPQHP